MNTTLPSTGIIGFLFDGAVESSPAPTCASICEMAAEIRRRIMLAFMQLQFCPGRPVEIDGEQWAPEKVYKALQDLYDWTYKACQQEEPRAAAFIVSSSPCSTARHC